MVLELVMVERVSETQLSYGKKIRGHPAPGVGKQRINSTLRYLTGCSQLRNELLRHPVNLDVITDWGHVFD